MTAQWLEFLFFYFYFFLLFFAPAVLLRFVAAVCWRSAASKLLWVLHDVWGWLLIIIYISWEFCSLYLFSLPLFLNISLFGIACGSCNCVLKFVNTALLTIFVCKELKLFFGMVQYVVIFYMSLIFPLPFKLIWEGLFVETCYNHNFSPRCSSVFAFSRVRNPNLSVFYGMKFLWTWKRFYGRICISVSQFVWNSFQVIGHFL